MEKTTPYEYELLSQLVHGEAQAFQEIYQLYQDKIYAFAYRLTKDKDTAQDMVQEVFIKLWEKREQVRIELNFGAYLQKMTQNHIFNYLKKVSLDRNLQQKVKEQLILLQETGADELLEKELQKAYTEAIEALPPQKKLVYLLSRQDDLSYDEIAAKLGISRNTVRNHMVEAIRQVREYIRNHTDLTALILAICWLQD